MRIEENHEYLQLGQPVSHQNPEPLRLTYETKLLLRDKRTPNRVLSSAPFNISACTLNTELDSYRTIGNYIRNFTQ
jgi:hypothetical protein